MTPILDARDLRLWYPLPRGIFGRGGGVLKAVDGVSFTVQPGEILGLVGESGCGKSSLAKLLLRLQPATGGSLRIAGEDFFALQGEALRRKRQGIQMVFQDPYGSLDPRMTVEEILGEPLRAHGNPARAERLRRIDEALEVVGLPLAARPKYPHEFSGGQRQRIAIARALILRPQILVADEPVSSLDVSVQAQILNLLLEIRDRLGLTMIFISHNLAVVRYLADSVAVMYLGKIVESGTRESVFADPRHPYTRALMAAVPIPDPKLARARGLATLTGEPPSPRNPPAGCPFHPRCPRVVERCRRDMPILEPVSPDGTQTVSCFEARK